MLSHKTNRHFYVAFNHFAKIGPVVFQRMENFFPSLEVAFNSSFLELERAGLNSRLTKEFLLWRKTFSLSKVLIELEKDEINYLTWHDPEYPALLKEIPAAPPILYFKGILNNNSFNRLAVVGSRNYSAYGDKTLKELLPPIIKEGIQIISGLALGVDSIAHRITLNNKGTTLAILGSGLDVNSIYPRDNLKLANMIVASGGAIISEFSPHTPPLKQNFPQRNRIISGLAQATLVVEAGERSGSLITANFSLNQNREVLAIPGNIFSPVSLGTNNLIKSGAKVITTPEDILEVFQIIPINKNSYKKFDQSQTKEPTNYKEKLIYNMIKQAEERSEKITTDEIIKISKLDTASINSKLSILEIKGIIKNTESGYELI